MTFGDLQTEAQTLVIDVPTAVSTLLPRMINRTIRKLQRKHNYRVMQASTSYVTTKATQLLGALPDDWKSWRNQPYHVGRFGGFFPMFITSEEADAVAQYGSSDTYNRGSPRLLNVDGSSINVYPYPDGLSEYADGEYRVEVPYWKMLPDLAAPGDSNWFTDNAEQYIIFDAVTQAFYAIEDEPRAQQWERRTAVEYRDVLLADKYSWLSGTSTLTPHLGALPPHTQE